MNITKQNPQAGDWSIQWIPGELCEMETAMKLLDHMAMLKKNADTAKVFQGTKDGNPVVYIVTRWG
jgi:hypothetical protein